MKNFARKLAYVLTLVMVLGVIAPVTTTVKAADATKVDATLDLVESETMFLQGSVEKYVWAEAKADNATEENTDKDIYKIGAKCYKMADITETREPIVDLSWLNGKATIIAFGYVDASGAYKFEDVKEIAAQDKDFKAFFTGKKFADADQVKAGKVTLTGKEVNAALVGEANDAGYFYFVGATSGGSVGLLKAENVEWKKGANGRWTNVTEDFVDRLPNYMAKGATLYFRAVNGEEAWPSKEVKVSYAKQAKATAVKVDIAKDTVALKNTMEYKVVVAGNSDIDWVPATANAENGRVGNVNLADLYVVAPKEKTAEQAATEGTKVTAQQLAAGNVELWVRLAGTAKKVVSKTYKIKLKAAAAFTESTVGTTTAGAIRVELQKNYDLKGGLLLTNTTANNVEYKVVGATKWSTLKAKKGDKDGTAKVATKDYVKDGNIASGAAVIFRYPGVKGTKVVTMAGATYEFAIEGNLAETKQKVTAATAKTGSKGTVTFVDNTVTINVADADVSTKAGITLNVDLKTSGVKETPKVKVVSTPTDSKAKATVKFAKDGAATLTIKVDKSIAAGTKVTYKVTTESKGNIAFDIVLNYGTVKDN